MLSIMSALVSRVTISASVSSRASNTPVSTQRRSRRNTLFHLPYSSGSSRHCAPDRAIHIMPSKYGRLSPAGRHPRPRSDGNNGPISAHSSSVILLLPASYLGTAAANGNAAIRAMIADPMSLLAMRSSGRRSAGALAQSKMTYAATDTPLGDFLGLSPEPDLPSVGGGSSHEPPPTPEPASDVPPTRDQTSFLYRRQW